MGIFHQNNCDSISQVAECLILILICQSHDQGSLSRNEKRIEFRREDSLDVTIHSYPQTREQSVGHLCKASLSDLLWEDRGAVVDQGRQVRWLDCHTERLVPASNRNIGINVYIYSMCSVNANGKRLLAVSSLAHGLHLYDMDTKNRAAVFSGGTFWGVAANGRGTHLFVCDQDGECVQVFSVDGSYLGRLEVVGEPLGDPVQLCWCEATSSLVVAHKINNDPFTISMIRVPLEQIQENI